MNNEQLTTGNYYHIFNRGNNRCNLFEKPEEYEHFLSLYDKYISPIADTLAWVLLRNHFHLLVYIKKDVVYKYSLETLNKISPDKMWFEEHKWETMELDLSASPGLDNVGFRMDNNIGDFNAVKSKNVDRLKEVDGLKNVDRLKEVDRLKLKTPVPYRHFAHLFNAYSRYLQIRTGRTGTLFERPFKRKIVKNEEYLKQVILYIHNNAVHHGFCSHPLEYPWSSYITSISQKATKLNRNAIINLFGDKVNFEYQHHQEIDIREIEKRLEIQSYDNHDFNLSLNAVKSKDVDRLKEDMDLSACAAPDNVTEKSNE